MLDDAFQYLKVGEDLQDSGKTEEAAIKYRDGAYLLKRYAGRLPIETSHKTIELLQTNIRKYEQAAEELSREAGRDSVVPASVVLVESRDPPSPLPRGRDKENARGGTPRKPHRQDRKPAPVAPFAHPNRPLVLRAPPGPSPRTLNRDRLTELSRRGNTCYERALDRYKAKDVANAKKDAVRAVEIYLDAVKLIDEGTGFSEAQHVSNVLVIRRILSQRANHAMSTCMIVPIYSRMSLWMDLCVCVCVCVWASSLFDTFCPAHVFVLHEWIES